MKISRTIELDLISVQKMEDLRITGVIIYIKITYHITSSRQKVTRRTNLTLCQLHTLVRKTQKKLTFS